MSISPPSGTRAGTDTDVLVTASRELPAPPWTRRALSTPVLVVAGVVSVVVLILVCRHIYAESPPAFMDLDVYRKGMQAWWNGGNMYGTLPLSIAGVELPFIYPPFAAVILGPMALVPWPVATIALLVLSLACLALVVYLTVRHVWAAGGRRGAVLAAAVLVPLSCALQPVHDTLWFGQINLLLIALVALDCLVEQPKWPRGLLIGIAAAVKLTPAVFVLYFLLRKDYRAAAVTAISGLCATAIGFVASWSGSLDFWFGSSGGARSVSGSTWYTNQTVDAYFARLGLPHSAQTLCWVLGVVVVLVLAVFAIRRATAINDVPLAFAVTGCLGLLASPTSWGHHWVYVVPGLIAMGARTIRQYQGNWRSGARWTLATLVTVVVFYEAPFLSLPNGGDREMHWTWWQQVFGNSYTIIGIVLLGVFAAPAIRAEIQTRQRTA